MGTHFLTTSRFTHWGKTDNPKHFLYSHTCQGMTRKEFDDVAKELLRRGITYRYDITHAHNIDDYNVRFRFKTESDRLIFALTSL